MATAQRQAPASRRVQDLEGHFPAVNGPTGCQAQGVGLLALELGGELEKNVDPKGTHPISIVLITKINIMIH